jgi:hypothetical protein
MKFTINVSKKLFSPYFVQFLCTHFCIIIFGEHGIAKGAFPFRVDF